MVYLTPRLAYHTVEVRLEQKRRPLVVYYSLDGNTQFIGESIAEAVSADALQLKTKRGLPSIPGIRHFLGGMQAVLGLEPKLEPYSVSLQAHDLLFIGTPIWASRHTPAVRAFLSRHEIEGKQVALFCCYAGNPGQAFEAMRKQIPNNSFVGEIGFKEPTNSEDPDVAVAKAREWAREMVSRASRSVSPEGRT